MWHRTQAPHHMPTQCLNWVTTLLYVVLSFFVSPGSPQTWYTIHPQCSTGVLQAFDIYVHKLVPSTHRHNWVMQLVLQCCLLNCSVCTMYYIHHVVHILPWSWALTLFLLAWIMSSAVCRITVWVTHACMALTDWANRCHAGHVTIASGGQHWLLLVTCFIVHDTGAVLSGGGSI